MKLEVETGVTLPSTKKCWKLPAAGRGQDSPLEPLEGTWLCQHLRFKHLGPAVWENKFLWFSATEFVLICSGRPRQPIQWFEIGWYLSKRFFFYWSFGRCEKEKFWLLAVHMNRWLIISVAQDLLLLWVVLCISFLASLSFCNSILHISLKMLCSFKINIQIHLKTKPMDTLET